jgi:hypothetical protein
MDKYVSVFCLCHKNVIESNSIPVRLNIPNYYDFYSNFKTAVLCLKRMEDYVTETEQNISASAPHYRKTGVEDEMLI